MKYLLLLLLVSCGKPEIPHLVDPDEACKSTGDCESNATEKAVAKTKTCESEDLEDVQCEDGKICSGLTKKDVLELFGEPDSVHSIPDMPLGAEETWYYEETTENPELCYVAKLTVDPPHFPVKCSIVFKEGLLQKQENFQVKYLDLQNL